RRSNRPSAGDEALGLEVAVGGDDRAEPILGGLVTAIGVGMVDLHEALVGLLDFVTLGPSVNTQRFEGLPVRLVQRLDLLALRVAGLGPGVAGKDVQRVGEPARLGAARLAPGHARPGIFGLGAEAPARAAVGLRTAAQ